MFRRCAYFCEGGPWLTPRRFKDAGHELLARDLNVLEDGPAVWDQLLNLCHRFAFGGWQVHDANIVATMLAMAKIGCSHFTSPISGAFPPWSRWSRHKCGPP